MALTKDERRALELARERINQRTEYICVALQDVGKETGLQVARLMVYVNESLQMGPIGTLFVWQSHNGFGDRGNEQRRADRLAWIDWMLGKPLPGEAVKLEWSSRSLCKDEVEYCGRTFVCYYADGRLFVYETTEGRNKYIGEFTSIEQADAAIVAHVWPAEKSEVV